ncbi:exonuclease SbcCD subunit D [Rhodovulum sp. PH10]|uniref:exonuclease SbcCD subunit D n=1 Tax=Rhodovulum sp. PH10 TaxID=1187851 RepID=UPI0012F7D8E8|nr:exonuclease SbcCD subunit D [Rhodovulum sp. PH10]
MRILHTADWHIGQTVNGWTREVEHRAFLQTLSDLVAAQAVDALIVAGDVFDGINPSAEAMQLLYESLLAMRERRPTLTTIMVAGNHDPAGRLEAPAALLRTIGVHSVGIMHSQGGSIDLDRHLVPLRDESGNIRVFGLAIPYLRCADLPALQQTEDEPGSPIVRATRELYAKAYAAARTHAGLIPLVATGHLHCTGTQESEGAERRILVGGEHAVPHDIFPTDLAYVALGHLHRPQQVARRNVRYSGSPFPLSATELPYEHGVSLIELHDGAVQCEHVRLPRTVPCIRVPETGGVTSRALSETLTQLAFDPDCPVESRPFLHVVVEPDGPAAGLIAEVDQILAEYPVRCASIKIERPQSSEEAGPSPVMMNLTECDPMDLFERAFTETHGVTPEPEHKAAFDQLRVEV